MITRPLGQMESALALTDDFSPLVLVSVLQVAAGPAPADLRRALDSLQARHTSLRVGIGGAPAARFFQPGAEQAIPLTVLERQGDAHWQLAAEAELNERLPAAGPLLRCTYVHASGPDAVSEIILSAHHSILDAAGTLVLAAELLSLCAGGLEDAGEIGLPPSADGLFPPAFHGLGRPARLLAFAARQMGDELAFQWHSRRARKPRIHLQAYSKLLTFTVPAALTAAVVRRCRAERVGLNSALNAALLAAVHQRLYGAAAMPLHAITFSNLRPYLKPPPAPGSLGCYVALLRYTLALGPQLGFWPLAQAIHQSVYLGARRGDKFSAVLLSPLLVGATNRLKNMRLAATALSYAGVVELEPAYGSTQVRGLHGFVSNHPLGPEFTAAVRLFRDELWWDCVYLDTDMDEPAAQMIATEIQQQLAGATKSGPAA